MYLEQAVAMLVAALALRQLAQPFSVDCSPASACDHCGAGPVVWLTPACQCRLFSSLSLWALWCWPVDWLTPGLSRLENRCMYVCMNEPCDWRLVDHCHPVWGHVLIVNLICPYNPIVLHVLDWLMEGTRGTVSPLSVLELLMPWCTQRITGKNSLQTHLVHWSQKRSHSSINGHTQSRTSSVVLAVRKI